MKCMKIPVITMSTRIQSIPNRFETNIISCVREQNSGLSNLREPNMTLTTCERRRVFLVKIRMQIYNIQLNAFIPKPFRQNT